MIAGAALAPFRDRLIALIAAAKLVEPPVVTPVVIPAGEPPLSAPEIAAGLIKTVFFDGFEDPATIDRGSVGTFAPPWKWASPYGDAVTGITVADSILRIAHDPNNGGGDCLNTMYIHGNEICGWGFKGSASISVAMRCDPSKAAPGSRTWPAFWSLAKEQLEIGLEQRRLGTCARADGSNPKHMEFDFVELGFPFPLYGSGESVLFALNYWECNLSLSRGYPTCDWNGVVMANPSAETKPDGFDFREMNIYTTVYLHPLDNNGRGSIKRYITRPGGVPFHVASCDHNWDAGEPYRSLIDKQTYPLLLGACAGFPAEFDWVCVRQKGG